MTAYELIQTLILVLVSISVPGLAVRFVRALRRGSIDSRFGPVARAEKPAHFRVLVAVEAFSTLVLAATGGPAVWLLFFDTQAAPPVRASTFWASPRPWILAGGLSGMLLAAWRWLRS